MSDTEMIVYYFACMIAIFGGLVALPMWWNEKLKDPDVQKYLKELRQQRAQKRQAH